MFNPTNKIIIVDDQENDLLSLAKVFLKNGIACKTILYDGAYESPLKGVRIAFFDIKILGKSFDNTQEEYDYKADRDLSSLFNDLAYAIETCISANNGPCALIFWSNNNQVIPSFKEYVNERYPDLPSPVITDCIDKDEFIGKTSEEFIEKFNSIFNKNAINLLFKYEEHCSIAAMESINDLFQIIPRTNSKWGSDTGFAENFDSIFSSLAAKKSGLEFARKNPDKAIYEALSPVLNFKLEKKAINLEWVNYLSKLKSGTPNYPTSFKKEILNSIFHLDDSPDLLSSTRGAVCEFKFKVSFCKKILFSLKPYFGKIEKELKMKFSEFVLFKEDVPQNVRESIRGKSKFIVLEISAACDYSQNKKRNHKYIMGLQTPKIELKHIDENKLSDAVFYKEVPTLYYENETIDLWFNFNFVLSSDEINRGIMTPHYSLKKELMDLITTRFANHISRIGITTA